MLTRPKLASRAGRVQAPKMMAERGLLALETGDPGECGWPNEPGVCMGLAGMGEVFVWAQRHRTRFSRKETKKATQG